MSPKVTDEYEQQQRGKIIKAATMCFCRLGYHETTVQDICDEAALSKGGLYTYFKSKEEILAAVVEGSFLGGLEQARGAVAAGGSAIEKFDRVAATVIDRLVAPEPYAAQSPQLLFEIWAKASKNPHLHALCAQGYERWREFLAGLLREGIAQGQFRPEVDPDALAAILVAVFDGLSLQEGITKAKVDWQRITSALRQGFGEGVIAEAARPVAQVESHAYASGGDR